MICLVFSLPPFNIDIDECQTLEHNCHAKAFCANTIGSYDCFCEPPYKGTGQICQSMKRVYTIIIIIIEG